MFLRVDLWREILLQAAPYRFRPFAILFYRFGPGSRHRDIWGGTEERI